MAETTGQPLGLQISIKLFHSVYLRYVMLALTKSLTLTTKTIVERLLFRDHPDKSLRLCGGVQTLIVFRYKVVYSLYLDK